MHARASSQCQCRRRAGHASQTQQSEMRDIDEGLYEQLIMISCARDFSGLPRLARHATGTGSSWRNAEYRRC